MKIEQYLPLEQEVLLLTTEAEKGPLSVEKTIHILSGKGRSLILIFLSLPFCLPIQIPGFSTPFGIAIAFMGFRMAFGHNIWLPNKILAMEIKPKILKTIGEKWLYIVQKIKPWIYPRLDFMCHSSLAHIFNGLLISLLGVILALPLPIPLSNLAAAWSILLIALGVLEDDGVVVLMGYLLSALTFVYFSFLVMWAYRII